MRRRKAVGGSNLQLEARTIQSLAVEKLREAITHGAFRPGEKLIEVDLCERLGISRPSLREALRTLEGERLVTLVPNRGPHVANLTWDDAKDIYHVRAILEGEAARLAANNAMPDDLLGMEEALVQFESAVHAVDLLGEIEATRVFYAHLLKAAGNIIIQDVLNGLLSRINVLRSRSMSEADRATSSSKELTAIFQRVRARDPEGAAEVAADHVRQAERSAERVFRQLFSDDGDP